jgi:hypothetical protein
LRSRKAGEAWDGDHQKAFEPVKRVIQGSFDLSICFSLRERFL